MKRCRALFFIFFAISTGLSAADVDLNAYYSYPISVSAGYQSLNPLIEMQQDFNIVEAFIDCQIPIPSLPVLHIKSQLGMLRFDARDVSFPLKWDHTHWYGTAGVSYVTRVIKEMELGADLDLGLSQSVFTDLVEVPVGSLNLFSRLSGRIGLLPSYNFSLTLQPNITWLKSLTAFSEYDSLLLGLTFAVNYRFGQDPDSAATLIRSLKFENESIQPVFGALQSYYGKNPIGTITLVNSEHLTLTDVEVYFYQVRFMDSPTLAGLIPKIKPGEKVAVPLLATFNQEIFSTEGITPLTGEIIVNYKAGKRPVEQRYPVNYDLYDKSSITWTDDRKAAAYITPSDSALRNYASFIRKAASDAVLVNYNQPLQTAAEVFGGLEEIGCLYQADPAAPFAQVQGNSQFVDSVSLPRDTLKRITGDCDDLTVLYASLLESVGVPSGFITIPGHIFPAFNTGVNPDKYYILHPDRTMTIALDGKLWIPVEITMLGDKTFHDAWRTGIDEWKAAGDKRTLYATNKAQEIYRPVVLKEIDLGLQYGNKANIKKTFVKAIGVQEDIVLGPMIEQVKKKGTVGDSNKLALTYILFDKEAEARDTFKNAIAKDKNSLAPRINLANLLFLAKDYKGAVTEYESTLTLMQKQGQKTEITYQKVLINLAKTYYITGKIDKSDALYTEARGISGEGMENYAYLAKAGNTQSTGNGEPGGKAAETRNPGADILFVEEDL